MSEIFVPEWESVKKKIDRKDSIREKLKLVWGWMKVGHIDFAQFNYIIEYVNSLNQPKVCPHYEMLKSCVWRADVKCHAGACTFISEDKER